jgi:hypothetical protein
MVKEITCYEDSSGKLHKSAYEAYRADLVLWLLNCSAVNEGSATQLAAYIVDNREDLLETLSAIGFFAPATEASCQTQRGAAQ